MTKLPDLECSACGRRRPVAEAGWRCTCGGVFDVAEFDCVAPELTALSNEPPSLWRYRRALPLPGPPPVSLGEGFTPLVRAPDAPGVWLKLDFLLPTLSFKDRGAVVVAELARLLGVPAAVADSSGNAGTAFAAYLARAGIRCEVFVPAATSPAKLDQMRAHGAVVRLVPGARADAARAAQEVADRGVFYASHVYQPYFLQGTKTYGYEVWEQLGGRVPDAVLVPVGNGTLLLGCHLAFEELRAQGRADRTPRIIGVQAAACAPLAAAMAADLTEPASVTSGATTAEGIAIADPARGAQVLAAVRASGGDIVTVTDSEVADARADLAAAGLFVEPTSAVCWAVARRARSGGAVPGWPDGGEVVVPLCGSGLKSR